MAGETGVGGEKGREGCIGVGGNEAYAVGRGRCSNMLLVGDVERPRGRTMSESDSGWSS